MIPKLISLILIGLVVSVATVTAIVAQSGPDDDLDKVRKQIRKHGIGEELKVVVTLKDGRKLKGHITQILDDSFDLTDTNTKQPTTIPYRDVVKVKRLGMPKPAKTAIGIGIAAGIVILVLTVPRKGLLGPICPLGCGPF
ncbi:MAG: hypothetical protein WBD16_01435 [Pyrinomonadaceae bacterium]